MMGDNRGVNQPEDADMFFSAEPAAQAYWEQLQRKVNLPVAAGVFLLLCLGIAVCLHVFSTQVEEFYYAVHRDVNYRDMRELNDNGNYLLLSHLAGNHSGEHEVALLGASFSAASKDPDPQVRMHRQLENELLLRAADSAPWQVTNLATTGFDSWALFYVTRLLRNRRQPDMLIVSLDILEQTTRSQNLVLDVGAKPGELTSRELACVIPVNMQLLFTSEANFNCLLRAKLPGMQAFAYLSTCHPNRFNAERWLRFSMAYIQEQDVDLPPPATRHADGTFKNWQELLAPGGSKQLPFDTEVTLPKLTPQELENLELLGAELAACQAEGTRVIVLTMPRNPLQTVDPQGVDAVLESWAGKYNLEFHNYWGSDLVPTEYYVDIDGHFMGEGNRIMAQEIARLVLPNTAQGGGVMKLVAGVVWGVIYAGLALLGLVLSSGLIGKFIYADF